ncbi:MAG: hypothetical protein ABIR98_15870 [Usitatibacter sp.]
MKEIVSLVPGFSVALARLPGTLGAYADLLASLEHGTLSQRSRMEIGLVVANRVRCDYCRWVMERLAANQGMREEDIFFAGMGISRGRREAAIVKIAQMMIAGAPLDPSAAARAPQARMFTQNEFGEIVAQVALSVLTCTVLQSVAPQTVTARKEA